MKKILLIVIVVVFFMTPRNVFAEGENRFVNIVNPVRISKYTNNIGESITSQYSVMKNYGLTGTWLLTDDVINNQLAIKAINNFDKKQELGVFLEVTPDFSERAKIIYNKTDSWFRADSLLLIGYSQADRIKLIDTIFADFKGKFGYYPTSVGAWWIDSYSLTYMRSKYNITVNLDCSDQIMTDGYGIWGQYWSLPYFPGKFHAGFPAANVNNKIGITTIQWAPRDPINGYKSSLYSTQDYPTIGIGDEYFEKLVSLYTNSKYNSFGQITVGLEGDFVPDAYQSTFKRQMGIISNLEEKGLQVVTMKQFGEWFQNKFRDTTPTEIIESDDLLNTREKIVWYQSPFYRIGITYNYETHETNVIDFRTYPNNFEEPYFLTSDKELNLYIRTPAVIDSGSNNDEKWKLLDKEIKSIDGNTDSLNINYIDGSRIDLTQKNINFSRSINISKIIKNSKLINIQNKIGSVQIIPKLKFDYSSDGYVFRELTPEANNFLKSKKVILFFVLVVGALIVLVVYFKKLLFTVIIFGLIFGIGKIWYDKNSKNYYVSQEEISALQHLSSFPQGKVVVYDGYCLQCSWETKYQPAVFANRRDYVAKISSKKIIYNNILFNAKTRKESKDNLLSLNAKYIYVVKIGSYKETVPFSPGDLGVKLIFENANAQIWQVN